MNRQYRKLQLLIRLGIIDINDFYVVRIYKDAIELQGTFTAEKALFYEQLFKSPGIKKNHENHYLIYERNNIQLTFHIN